MCKASRVSVRLDELTTLAQGLDHPEGVTTDRDGVLYAGGEAGQVYRIDIDTDTFEQVGDTGGFLLGLCADSRGLLYCCDVGRKEVVLVDPRTGEVSTYSSGSAGRQMVNPNWPVFDDTGNLYVTDSGTWKGDDGCVFKISPGGSTEVWSSEATNFPNGACLSADGSALLVLESCSPALVEIPIESGTAGRPREIARLTGIPDGIALDIEGNAYVCYYRPDRIDRITPGGSVETLAEDPEGTVLSAPTNGVWVGEDLDEFIVGNLGRWHLTRCRWGVRGLPLRYPDLGAA